jgi:hypothetical protein
MDFGMCFHNLEIQSKGSQIKPKIKSCEKIAIKSKNSYNIIEKVLQNKNKSRHLKKKQSIQ